MIRSSTADLLHHLHFQSRPNKGNLEMLAEPLESWLAKSMTAEMNEGLALECLGWANALPRLAAILPAGPWNSLLDCLQTISKDALNMASLQAPVLQQYLAAELPITLAYVFPEIDTLRDDAQEAMEIVAEAITEFLDGEGLPHASNRDLLRPLTACWTRCLTMAEALKIEFDGDARLQFEWLVRQLIRLTRPDGTQVLSSSDGVLDLAMLRAVLKLVEDPDDQYIASLAIPSKKAATVNETTLPSPATHSEWAETAILRTQWRKSRSQFTVAFHQPNTPIELLVDSHDVFTGPWSFQITVDDELLQATDDWKETCWHTDNDLDFLELTMPLNNGWTMERQIILCRRNNFLLLADVVLGERTGQISYRGSLPLNTQMAIDFAPDTREATIHGKRQIANVMPLALPEWRVDSTPDSLTLDDGNLVLQQSMLSQRMYAPLFIDLDKQRQTKPLTWRQLTVAEHLEIQPKDVAVGYRIQSDRQHWMLYRSLARKGNRTLLGQNFFNEFYLAEISTDGSARELIEIGRE
jgi:hypothetical protein